MSESMRVARKYPLFRFGVMGRKGHGKDTFAQALASASLAPYTISHFAGPLKDLCREVFGLSDHQLNTLEGKEGPLPTPLAIDDYLPRLVHLTGLPLAPRGVVAFTPREVLQVVGTDYVRSARETYWLDRAEAVLTGGTHVIFADTRFPNEAETIRRNGGKIIRIFRIDAPENGDLHPSEAEGDSVSPDLLLGVRTGDLSLVQTVCELIVRGKWDFVLRYDYRRVKEALSAYQTARPISECLSLLGISNAKGDSAAFRYLRRYYGCPSRSSGEVSSPHIWVAGVESKRCSSCAADLPLGEFNRNAKSWDGLHCLCRGCARMANAATYQKYGRSISFSLLCRQAQHGALRRGIPFTLTEEDVRAQLVAQEGLCAYSGVPLSFEIGSPTRVSIDRVDSAGGYSPDNIRLCTARVNMMKGPLSLTEFRGLVALLCAHLP